MRATGAGAWNLSTGSTDLGWSFIKSRALKHCSSSALTRVKRTDCARKKPLVLPFHWPMTATQRCQDEERPLKGVRSLVWTSVHPHWPGSSVSMGVLGKQTAPEEQKHPWAAASQLSRDLQRTSTSAIQAITSIRGTGIADLYRVAFPQSTLQQRFRLLYF